MEIADFLAAARRQRWLLILVPVLSSIAAVAYSVLSPATYTAQATVISPSLVGTPFSQFSGPQSIDQFVSTFYASTAAPAVIDKTAREAGVSAASLTENVAVTQVGASSNVTLTYSDIDEAKADLVARTLASNALENMYSAQVQVADQQVASAEAALATANQDLQDYLDEIGVGDPSAAYQSALNQVTVLQQTQATFAAQGETESATEMQSFIDVAQERVSDLGASLPEYHALLSARSMATTSYESELTDRRSIHAQATAAAAPGIIATQGIVSDKSLMTTIKLTITIFGASLLIAILLVALIEFIAALRRQSSRQTETTASS